MNPLRLNHLRSILIGAVMALLTIPAFAQTSPVSGGDAMVKLTLSEPTQDFSKSIYNALNQSQVIPDFIQAINDMFIFPRPIEIRGEDCEEGNYPAPSSALPIRLCYGLIRQTALIDNGMSEDAQRSQVVAAAFFTVLNYLAPVMTSQFDLHVSEEDKSGMYEFAAVLALSVGDAIKAETLEDLARTAQDIAAAEENQEIQPYWILSGLTKPQANIVACMIYGSDPARFADLMGNDETADGQDNCGAVFSQKMEYWSSLIDSHLRK